MWMGVSTFAGDDVFGIVVDRSTGEIWGLRTEAATGLRVWCDGQLVCETLNDTEPEWASEFDDDFKCRVRLALALFRISQARQILQLLQGRPGDEFAKARVTAAHDIEEEEMIASAVEYEILPDPGGTNEGQ